MGKPSGSPFQSPPANHRRISSVRNPLLADGPAIRESIRRISPNPLRDSPTKQPRSGSLLSWSIHFLSFSRKHTRNTDIYARYQRISSSRTFDPGRSISGCPLVNPGHFSRASLTSAKVGPTEAGWESRQPEGRLARTIFPAREREGARGLLRVGRRQVGFAAASHTHAGEALTHDSRTRLHIHAPGRLAWESFRLAAASSASSRWMLRPQDCL